MPKKQEAAEKKPTPKRKTNYLSNKSLLAEVIKSKEAGEMSDELAKMLQLLTARYGKKGNFVNYTYNEDMQAYAMMSLVKTWNGFDPAKSSNPFAFFTQCIKNSFIQYLKLEKRQRVIRDELLVDSGLTPSYNYQMEHEARKHVHDEEDHEQHVKDAEDLDKQEQQDDLIQY